MAVYGVTTDYLSQSAIKPAEGKIFDSNELSTIVSSGEVAGEESVIKEGYFGQKIEDVEYSLFPEVWAKVRRGPSIESEVIPLIIFFIKSHHNNKRDCFAIARNDKIRRTRGLE